MQKLQQRINRLKSQIKELGPMRPGSLSRQYNVCGKPGCRCKDPKNPRRHGPYYQLNYVYGGKKTSEFVRPQNLKAGAHATGQLQALPPPDRSMDRFSPQTGPIGIGKMTP